MSGKLVLVTGASGFVACHVIQQLLQGGYKVRGTVRSLKNETKVQPIRDICPEKAENLHIIEADLLEENCWKDAVTGCDYVLHLASPFPAENVADENVLIKPAVNGTLNVLRAASYEPNVKRVVLTSSCAAIYRGESQFELTTINPSVILGPMLHKTESTTVQMIKQLLQKDIPMLAKVCFGCVDVRDVAKAHIIAMEHEDAAGQRFLLSEKSLWLKEIAEVLAREFGPLGYDVPTMVAPNAVLWLGSHFDKTMKMLLPYAGQNLALDNTKVRTVLGLEPMRSAEQAIIDMGHSLIEKGIVKQPKKCKISKS